MLFDDGASSAQNLALLNREAEAEAGERTASHSSSEEEASHQMGAGGLHLEAGGDLHSGHGPLEGSRRINIDVSDSITSSLADQLAAVCCSPPRHETGQVPWRGSSPSWGQ